jgi:serine/threonine protein phosphatase PrpC/DNA-directed RNA polymerase subunit RPC12/RpoP
VERVVSTTVTEASPCPACGEVLVPGARFCEACGAATGVEAPEGVDAEDPAALDAAEAPAAEPGEAAGGAWEPGAARCVRCGAAIDADGYCTSCGHRALEPDEAAGEGGEPGAAACVRCGAAIDADGYCTSCGHRALEPVVVNDGRSLAFATHRGRRHHRNEDSGALAATAEGWPVLIVSDGVSASPNPHLASAAVVAAVAERLGGRAFHGAEDLAEAVAAGQDAAEAVPAEGDPQWPEDGTHPACTLVAVVVAAGEVHVANVGDARAHVLRPDAEAAGGWAAVQISTDDSMAAAAVAAGVDPSAALEGPAGHAITAWLGADAPVVEPHIGRGALEPGDLILACSDGLWNYAPTDAAMGELAGTMLPAAGEPVPFAAVCERLVIWAVDAGGMDNICVALTGTTEEAAT